MHSPTKRPKLIGQSSNVDINAAATLSSLEGSGENVSQPIANAEDETVVKADDQALYDTNDLSICEMDNKVIASILGFLSYKDIMRSRICCRKFRDAAKSTMVPWANGTRKRERETKVTVKSVNSYRAVVAMSKALPNLQHLDIFGGIGLEPGKKYRDGVDPDEKEATRTASWNAYDIRMISNFQQLRELDIRSHRLNGKYPFLFEFPLLESLDILCTKYLKWDLSMLRGVPSLKKLIVSGYKPYKSLTGSIKGLCVLKGTLEQVRLCSSEIKGDIMDLADFPHLKRFDLKHCSKVTGDLRDIKASHFPALKTTDLSQRIIGSWGHNIHSISDVPSAMEAMYRLSQRGSPFVQNIKYHYLHLSDESPDHYESKYKSPGYPAPPFFISFVQVGPRMGWRWKTQHRRNSAVNSCEVNWIDPEPSRDSSDYDDYIRKLESIEEEIFCYEGFHQPPTEEEYKRLCEEYYGI